MNAIVFKLTDFAERTPEQMIRIFFQMYDASEVRKKLWQVFVAYSSANCSTEKVQEEEEIAAFFDQLVFLAAGVEQLRNNSSDTCALCGKTAHD